MFKPYGERYLGLVEDLMENPPEETPGWHASEQETSIMLAYDPSGSYGWIGPATRGRRRRIGCRRVSRRADGAWDAAFKGYEYFYFPMDHNEFAEHGVIGNPMRATAEKGNAIFDRFAAASRGGDRGAEDRTARDQGARALGTRLKGREHE